MNKERTDNKRRPTTAQECWDMDCKDCAFLDEAHAICTQGDVAFSESD